MKLEIINYTKKINGKLVLNNINIAMESGNIYGFHGRNGSGKTMLFRAIVKLIHPTSGDVLVNGKSIIEEDFDLSRIGLLLENPGFYPYLTGFQNLELLYTLNNPKNDKHIDNYLDIVGLSNAKDSKYKTYSLGMKQRLGIAQALMEDQDIIILDEPTNGLDENGINDMRTLIIKEKEREKLILIASHSKEDLSLLCDVVFNIENGECRGEIEL